MLHHRIFTRDAADAGVFTRDVTLSPSSWNAEQRTFSVVVSSGADVVRQDARGPYIERPDINQNWRQLVGAPVLNSHQRNDIKNILGSVTDVSVVGQQVHATIRMSKSPEGEAAVQAAREGHLRGISFGYRIDATKESVEGGRRIVLATDRYISMQEARNQPRSIDYPFTLFEIRVNKDGEGEGKLAVATKIRFDKEKKVMELENYSSEPVRLQNLKLKVKS